MWETVQGVVSEPMLNPRLDELLTYPFERLSRLLDGVYPPQGVEPISLAVGEPHHAPPPFGANLLAAHADDWGRYPPNRGTPGFRAAIAAFVRLRNFASCQTPLPIVTVAEHLWRDESHVHTARTGYRARFDVAQSALGGRYGFSRPDGGFFLWLDVGDGTTAARRLWAEAGLRVLPGACLCPDEPEHQPPGARHIRLALVREPDTIGETLMRLRRVLN